MPPVVALCLLLQTAIVVLTLRRAGGSWPCRLGVLFLLSMYAYHGLTEVLQWRFPNRNTYRLMVTPDHLETWVVIVTVAMGLFAIGYRVASGPVSHAPPERARRLAAALPPLPILLGVAGIAFLNVLATQGGADGYASSGLARQFLVPAIVLAAAGVGLRSPHLALHAVVAAALLTSLVGSRIVMLVVAVSVLGCLALGGARPSRRSLTLVAGAGLVVAFAISGARAEVGREAIQQAGPFERIATIGGGLSGANREVILNDIVYRFDGNSVGAMTSEQFAAGTSGVEFHTLVNSVQLAIPRFLNPAKLSSDEIERSDKAYALTWFGFPATRGYDQGIDYLMTTPVILYGYFGLPGLLLFAPVLGLAFGRIDRWLAARESILTLPVFVGLAQPVLQLNGVDVYFIVFRGAVVLAVILVGLTVVAQLLPTPRLTTIPQQRPAHVKPLVSASVSGGPPRTHSVHAARMRGQVRRVV